MWRFAILILFLIPFLIISMFSESFAQSNWSLVPSLTISEAYDSNIFSTTTEVADYITEIGANLYATYNGSNVGLQGHYHPQFNAYARRPRENVVTQDGSFNIELNRWFQKLVKMGEMTVSEDFTLTPDLRDYYFDEKTGGIGSLSSYGIRTKRSDVFRNASTFNVSLPVTLRLNLSANYSNLLTEYKSPEFQDSVTNAGGFGIRYTFPGDIVYSNVSESKIRSGIEDSISYSLIVGVRHSLSPLTTFDVNGGVATLDHKGNNGDSTFSGGASLTKLSRLHTYNAGYSRSLNTVSSISGIPSTADILYFNITNIHSKDLTSNIGSNYSINKSHIGGDVDTHSYNLSGTLNYTIRQWLRSSLTASHFNQESNRVTVINMKRDMITLAVVGTWK